MEYEMEFAKLCGKNISSENNFYDKTISLSTFGQKRKLRSKSWNLVISNSFHNNLESYKMPDNWEFSIEPLREIFVLNNQPRSFHDRNQNSSGVLQNYLYRYRMIIFLAAIDEIPLEYQIYNNYFISFEFFGQTIKYKLELTNGMNTVRGYTVLLNKIQLSYFYSSGKEQTKNFLINEQVILSFCKNKLN